MRNPRKFVIELSNIYNPERSGVESRFESLTRRISNFDLASSKHIEIPRGERTHPLQTETHSG
jgi:hypothetical protein